MPFSESQLAVGEKLLPWFLATLRPGCFATVRTRPPQTAEAMNLIGRLAPAVDAEQPLAKALEQGLKRALCRDLYRACARA